MPNKSLLVVTTSFFPENAIGAVRVTKLTKYLSYFYEDVTIIAPSIDESVDIDITLDVSGIENLKIYRVTDFLIFRLLKKLRNSFLTDSKGSDYIHRAGENRVKKVTVGVFFSLFTHIKNLNFSIKASVVFFRLKKDKDFHHMLTSYPSYGSHVAGILVKKIVPSIFWIADFRDPMVYPSIKKSKIFQFIQKSIIEKAQLVTSISHGVKGMIQGDMVNKKVKVLYNGFDGYQRLSKDPILCIQDINFTYMGSLYGGKRDISVFFKFLQKFITENPHYETRIKVNYAGSDFSALLKMASVFHMDKYLVDHGKVNRSKSLQMQEESNFVLVATWNTIEEQGILTGKIFEALMLNKSVIATVCGDKKDSELKQIIEAEDAGIVIETSFTTREDYENFSILLGHNIENNTWSDSEGKLVSRHQNFHYQNLARELRDLIEVESDIHD